MKIISKNCEKLKDIIKFKNIDCNFNKNKEELKQSKNVVILGNFDGLHKGHKTILENAINTAKKNGYKTIVYTFFEYPQKVQTRITTPTEKIYLIEEMGIDYLYLDEFNEVKEYSPEDFVQKILIDTLNVKEVFCGFNFTFGAKKSGNIMTLDNLLKEKSNNNIELNVQPPVIDSENEIISSTRIRNYIEEANFVKIKELLGHNYIIMGEVVHGKKLGRTIGFPTANLNFEDKIYPNFGVYGAYIHIEGDNTIYHSVINIGKNPSVEFKGFTVEAHIFDFNEDIYGKTIVIEVLEKIRNETKFNSIDELKEQINNDSVTWRKRINEKYYDTSKNR